MNQGGALNHQYWWSAGIYLQEVLRNKELILFLDYDGTLAPIAKIPNQAVIDDRTRETLTTLSQITKCHVILISGRTLPDLKQMVNIPQIIYIANHGFEVDGEINFNFQSMIPSRYFDDLANIKEILHKKLTTIEGLWIEDKGINLTVHYRAASERAGKLAQKIFQRECKPYVEENRISVMHGKKVLEIRPSLRWTKGEAALLILHKLEQKIGKEKTVTIYLGDDVTDEDAFKVLNQVGITIRVEQLAGSFAQYFLESQPEVLDFLREIAISLMNGYTVDIKGDI